MATGEAHKFNVLKYKILAGLLRARKPMTTQELADLIDVDVNKVRSAISRCHKRDIKYIRRLPKQAAFGAYRYKITKSGIAAYIDYKNRMKHGLTLNRLHATPWKMDSYMQPTRRGVLEMGLTMNDVDYSLQAFEARLATTA